ncbi:shikimate kinase [Acetobacterium tundrae]|uniref:Shikimate kinase n=1 Tax=Acetobacterium tundrae TaxID=132932 RepID=A0ABR6WN41_9FIRM|nr:shikimate kinase [Acetobacterium tundrae]MBC3797904.1 AAA family ATPase [Acetobacterium tundrae]
MEEEKTCIALIGFMGTGKSTIGPLLAKKLNFTFVDTDDLVETAMGMKIADIFSDLGESAFREAEYEVLKEAVTGKRVVLSTGGGIVLFERNRKLLKENAYVVSLTAQPETIFIRVQENETRPLLKSEDPLRRIRQMMAERQKYYDDCDLIISTDDYTALECCERVVKSYRAMQKKTHQ